MAFLDFLRKKGVAKDIATAKPEGNTDQAPPDPEWRYHRAYSEGGAQAKYAAGQGSEGQVQTPAASTATTSPEGGTRDARPDWIRQESQRLTEGQTKEAVAQIPQSPPPASGENKG